MSGHIEDDAMGLCALPPGDPQRAAAFAHARSCEPCRRALEGAAALLGHIDALTDVKPPSAGVLRAIARPVVAELSLRAVPVALVAAALGAVWAFLVVSAKSRAAGVEVWLASASLLLVAISCVGLVRRLRGGAAALALGASVAMAALTWAETGAVSMGGLPCLLTELGGAVLPFLLVASVYWRRRTLDLGTPLVTVAAAGALAAQAAIHLTCPGRGAGLHVLVFHVGGVLAALVVSALAARLLRRAAA